MAESSAFIDPQRGLDHYTRPYDHIVRIDTALSNTAARLHEFAEKNLNPNGKPKDKLGEQLTLAVTAITKVHDQVLEIWKKTGFKDLCLTERLTLGSDSLKAGKNVLIQTETEIKKAPGDYGPEYERALKVITAQHARLDGVLEEHRERERPEAANALLQERSQVAKPHQDAHSTATISGFTAKARPAQTESGVYRGSIVAITESAVLQQISADMTVLHQRRLLDKTPEIAQKASINYSRGTAVVKTLNQFERENSLSR